MSTEQLEDSCGCLKHATMVISFAVNCDVSTVMEPFALSDKLPRIEIALELKTSQQISIWTRLDHQSRTVAFTR